MNEACCLGGQTIEHRSSGPLPLSPHLKIKIPLKSGEHLIDLHRRAEVCHGVGDRVVVAEAEQGRELLDVEFLDANRHIVLQHEVEERLLVVAESRADMHPRGGRPCLAGQGRHGEGHIGQHVEQVAGLGIDDPLHLGQLLVAEAFLRQSLQERAARFRRAPDGAQFLLVAC